MYKYFAIDAKSRDILISGQNTYVNTFLKNTMVTIIHIIWWEFQPPIVTDPSLFLFWISNSHKIDVLTSHWKKSRCLRWI